MELPVISSPPQRQLLRGLALALALALILPLSKSGDSPGSVQQHHHRLSLVSSTLHLLLPTCILSHTYILAPFPYHLLLAPPSLLLLPHVPHPSRPHQRPSFFSSLHCHRHLISSISTCSATQPPRLSYRTAPLRCPCKQHPFGINPSINHRSAIRIDQSRERRVFDLSLRYSFVRWTTVNGSARYYR